MTTMEEIVNQLDSLTRESLTELARFIDYLRWKQSPAEHITIEGGDLTAYPAEYRFRSGVARDKCRSGGGLRREGARFQGSASPQVPGQSWSFDFVEHFRRAMITADYDPAGMEVQISEATCDGDQRMALWQHPPVQGSAIVEYQVPIPADVRDLRLRFATGIRDGSHLAEGNVVAFRIFANNWKIWSDTQHIRKWNDHDIVLPALPGDVARIQFMTDGLGNHQWAWAVWGEPRLVGQIVAQGEHDHEL